MIPISLDRFVRDTRAPLGVVLCPAGESVESDLAFLREARRSVLWPPPAEEIWNAIAGLRGSHDAPPRGAPTAPRGTGRRSALFLEGEVTLARARRAAAFSEAPREWIVERVQRVRLGPSGLDEMRRLGIRWAALDPVRVVALVATPALGRARRRWSSLLPADVAVWPLTSRPESRVPRPE